MNFLRQHGIGHAKNPPDSTATWNWGPRSHLRNLNPCHIIVGGPLSKVDSVRIVAYSLAVVAVVRGCRGTGIASQPLSSRRIVCWGRTGEKGREPLCLRSIYSVGGLEMPWKFRRDPTEWMWIQHAPRRKKPTPPRQGQTRDGLDLFSASPTAVSA